MNNGMMKWYRVALFNLFVLTLIGLVLRYKISFPLEFIEQKKLLHAHSHFAFNGWISFLLQILIVDLFTRDYSLRKTFWDKFFLASTIVNYGMVVAFALQGYAGVSIALSTLALWLSYVFVYAVVKGMPEENKEKISTLFIKAALFFLVVSSIGPYLLAIIIATKNLHQYWYHNALYFFLHFQYNGWFLFGVLGFLLQKFEKQSTFEISIARKFFYLLFITCFPAYLLTVLWYKTPYIATVINIITVLMQAYALVYLKTLLAKNYAGVFKNLPVVSRVLYSLAIAAFVLKVLLQFFSAHPVLGQLAFSFRPIIIGYLHLIFLVFVSLFLLGKLSEMNIIPMEKRSSHNGLFIFTAGVIINELLLGMQGVASIFYWYLPVTQLLLFFNTIVMALGAFIIYRSSTQKTFYPSINIQHYARN